MIGGSKGEPPYLAELDVTMNDVDRLETLYPKNIRPRNFVHQKTRQSEPVPTLQQQIKGHYQNHEREPLGNSQIYYDVSNANTQTSRIPPPTLSENSTPLSDHSSPAFIPHKPSLTLPNRVYLSSNQIHEGMIYNKFMPQFKNSKDPRERDPLDNLQDTLHNRYFNPDNSIASNHSSNRSSNNFQYNGVNTAANDEYPELFDKLSNHYFTNKMYTPLALRESRQFRCTADKSASTQAEGSFSMDDNMNEINEFTKPNNSRYMHSTKTNATDIPINGENMRHNNTKEHYRRNEYGLIIIGENDYIEDEVRAARQTEYEYDTYQQQYERREDENIFGSIKEKDIDECFTHGAVNLEGVWHNINEQITPNYINNLFRATSIVPLSKVNQMLKDEKIDTIQEEYGTTGTYTIPTWDLVETAIDEQRGNPDAIDNSRKS